MAKLRVAVCDDDPLDLRQTLDMIQQYDNNKSLEVVSYVRASDLLKPSAMNTFDIVLLDIEMEMPNGYEVAKQLVMAQYPPVIIFVTKSSAYSLKGYGIALRYLQKPLNRTIFDEALDASI